jgi:hypothetical protein
VNLGISYLSDSQMASKGLISSIELSESMLAKCEALSLNSAVSTLQTYCKRNGLWCVCVYVCVCVCVCVRVRER